LRKEVFFNNSTQKYRVLVAPLDWGLGHATRCIPIIKELINLNCEVLIAANKKDYLLLKKSFQTQYFYHAKGMKLNTAAQKNIFPFNCFCNFLKSFSQYSMKEGG
jgi:hypothetical protein